MYRYTSVGFGELDVQTRRGGQVVFAEINIKNKDTPHMFCCGGCQNYKTMKIGQNIYVVHISVVESNIGNFHPEKKKH